MLYNFVSTTKESPSLIVFEILAKIAFITFHLGPRTNAISPNEKGGRALFFFMHLCFFFDFGAPRGGAETSENKKN